MCLGLPSLRTVTRATFGRLSRARWTERDGFVSASQAGPPRSPSPKTPLWRCHLNCPRFAEFRFSFLAEEFSFKTRDHLFCSLSARLCERGGRKSRRERDARVALVPRTKCVPAACGRRPNVRILLPSLGAQRQDAGNSGGTWGRASWEQGFSNFHVASGNRWQASPSGWGREHGF